ncbi:MFS transporter [Agromyces subbeticus]|uniref:MFS transporter n=1 Tax=Agromyces subbeticus TaxID=293890 RepID=UPI00041D64FE|nr:MFS transporter [Agromyces subbeticus]
MSLARRGLYVAFAGMGATAAAIPALLPSIERAVGAPVLTAVPALFGGLLVGVLASSPVLRRAHPLRVAAIGCLVQAVALGAAALAGTAATFVIFAALAGFGFGLTEAAGSVAAKSVARSSTTAILTALTGTVAVAAALTPLLVAAAAGSDQPGLILIVVAGLQVAAGAVLLTAGRGAPAAGSPSADSAAPGHRTRALRRTSLIALLPLAIALPLYVGVETVFAGWSAVIPAELLHLDPAAAALGTSAFWALMAAGRFTSSAVLRRGLAPRRALVIALIAAAMLLGIAALTAPVVPVLGLVAIAAAVVALAPTYAIVIGLALDRLDDIEAAHATGVLVACGAVGGTFVPALVLLVTDQPAGSVTFAVTAALCLAIAGLSAVGVRRVRPATTESRIA